jgi:hypothetical protein
MIPPLAFTDFAQALRMSVAAVIRPVWPGAPVTLSIVPIVKGVPVAATVGVLAVPEGADVEDVCLLLLPHAARPRATPHTATSKPADLNRILLMHVPPRTMASALTAAP